MGKKRGFCPDWTTSAPGNGSFRSIFKWGAPDQFKHPNPGFYALLKDELALTDADFQKKMNEGNEQVRCDVPIGLSQDQIHRFIEMVGEDNVALDDYSRVKYSNGKTAEEIMKLRRGIVGELADLVVHPRNQDDVRHIVAYCHEHEIPVYAHGGGSSVTMGFKCTKGGICIDLSRHMNKLLELNEINHTATVQPGILGPQYEYALNHAPELMQAARRYTCGHFPQSFEFSSVGGWIAASGSGQQSTYYGDMYDIVISQEYVTPVGEIKTLDYPATATGPKVNDIMKGSEGTYGILVSATLKIFRYMPENRQRFAFVFPDWHAAVDAAREICQGEFGMPSVFRISDPEETEIAMRLYGIDDTIIDKGIALRGFRPGKRCICVGQAEGSLSYAKNVKKNIKKVCRLKKGMYISGYPMKNWEQGRYADPYMREDLDDFGIMVDTLESSVTWDGLHRLYDGVRGYIKSRKNTVCMTHASHFYPQGTNLYFIFIARMDDIDEYHRFQSGIIDKIEAHGGSLSHHHGVGKMIGPWMKKHLGEQQMNVLKAIKNHFDPNGIMNPGGTLGFK
ncbi:MAG: FAD-binding oxidoreductase [Deltaproteobacteria bacterium]|nr:FAD-binding oxidoreductase [Deltaproteobacteria bacterium]